MKARAARRGAARVSSHSRFLSLYWGRIKSTMAILWKWREGVNDGRSDLNSSGPAGPERRREYASCAQPVRVGRRSVTNRRLSCRRGMRRRRRRRGRRDTTNQPTDGRATGYLKTKWFWVRNYFVPIIEGKLHEKTVTQSVIIGIIAPATLWWVGPVYPPIPSRFAGRKMPAAAAAGNDEGDGEVGDEGNRDREKDRLARSLPPN